MCLPQFDTLTETGQEKQMGHTISELWYFGYPVPQLCLTRRRRSFVRVVEDAGFVTRSSHSSFLVFLRRLLFHSQDARRTDTKRVTNGWRIGLLIPHGRERRRFFFRAVHYHSEVRSKSSEQWQTTEQGGWWCCVRP